MSFNYQNPTAGTIFEGPVGVALDNSTGTNFSVFSIGGYMEVYSHQDLIYTIPPGTEGQVLNSGNTIPIAFSYNQPFGDVADVLTLYSDEISSGRRRLGMMVYVISADTTYQFIIDNYKTLWDNAQNSGALGFDGSVWTCDAHATYSTEPGNIFVDAWTGSTIEGVNGVTRENARWKIANMNDTVITGGTYFSANTTLQLYDNFGGTVTVTGFTGTVTGGTFNSGTSTLNLNNSDGSIVSITGFTSGGGGSPLSVGDGTTTVTSVSGITFSGATVIDDGDGNITVSITGGTSGTSGTSGSSGTSGTSGSSGTDGTSGSSGTDGTSGSSGTDGTSGSSGTTGTSGTSGSSGLSGVNGTSGTSGTSGSDGTSGSSGTDGTSGSSGTDGTSGSSGTDGTSGSSGTDGTSGSSGSDGTSGSSGVTGCSGFDGTSGTSGTSGTLLFGTSTSSITIP